MKKTAAVLLILLMAASLVCCHQKEKTQPTEMATPSEAAVTNADDRDDSQNDQQGSFSGASVLLEDFTVISQLPDLPTGCEVTSLAMALNYAGVPADKCDIADNYLEKGEVGTVDFRVAFEGDPRDENSFGCYAPVLKNAADRYLSENGYAQTAEDLTGTDFDQLLTYLDSGTPVIVWGTVDCETPVNRTTWVVDGVELKWYSPEHCMVLIGYDDTTVTVADPLKGEKATFDRELFKTRYNDLFQQAIVIVNGGSSSEETTERLK